MPNDPLKLASEALTKAIDTEKRNRKLLDSIGPAIIQALSPVLNRIETAVSRMKIDVKPVIEVNPQTKAPEVTVNVPDFPEIRVPTPIVNYTPPAINIPRMEMPDEMNIKGWVSLMGVDLEHPLPVQLRNPDGSPFSMAETLNVFGGGGGRSGGNVKVTGYDASAFYYAGILNPDGRLKVETNDGTSSASTEVKQVSGTVDSVVVNDILAVSTVFPVSQVSGHNWSVTAFQGGTWDEVGINDSGNSITIDTTQSFETKQVSGTIDSVSVTNTVTVSATDLDIRDLNVVQDELLVHQVSGASWSVSLSTSLSDVTDTIGTQQVSGAIDSTQTKLIARQTNPTAASDAASVFASADDLGRVLTRPIQVRDLIVTAFATITDSSEDTLIAGVASTFLDLIYVMAANESGATVNLAFRTGTGGATMFELQVPASGTAGVALPVPIPASEVAQAWTVQNTGSDISGTTVNVSALFSKEV